MGRQSRSRSARSPREMPARGRQVPPRRKTGWIWAAGLALVTLAGIGLFLAAAGSAALTRLRVPRVIEGVVTTSNPSRDHVEGAVTYPETPPVGGPHNAVWQTCGVYDQPVPNEHAVHSLEHGAVWITYRPDLPVGAVEQLRALVRNHSHALLSPFPGLPTPVVASAWGLQLKVDSADDPRLRQFIAKYERGEQTPEPGASCRGGVGNPVLR